MNNRGWVFENVHPQYSIALAVVRRGDVEPQQWLSLRGPFAHREDFAARRIAERASFEYAAVRQWNETIALPLLPSDRSGEVFAKLRKHPSFGEQSARSWRARPLQGDINATTGQEWMDFEARPSAVRWPVYAGESFDIWTADTGNYYAVADSSPLTAHLQERRERSMLQMRSVFSEFDAKWAHDPKALPCRHPRIAFRTIVRQR